MYPNNNKTDKNQSFLENFIKKLDCFLWENVNNRISIPQLL